MKKEEIKAKMLKLEREREIEEYNYKIKREREISNNNWKDEKAERENNLAKKEIEVTVLLKEAESNVEHIKELESKVDEIPLLLEKEYAKGRKEATSYLQEKLD